jgi:FtsH-binding integral membrane protein
MYNEAYPQVSVDPKTIDMGLRSWMLGVYNNMSIALAVTGVVAYISSFILQPLMTTPIWYLFVFSPLLLILAMPFVMKNFSIKVAFALFMAFSALMGLSMSSIFVVYTSTSIAKVFFITAATFASASLYGYTTGRDLTSMGSFLIMGVFGLIIASVVNIFLASSILSWIISVVGVIAFTGLTAYDTQKLKEEYLSNGEVYGFDSPEKSSIFGALTLYLDCVNIFISLLQLLGERK